MEPMHSQLSHDTFKRKFNIGLWHIFRVIVTDSSHTLLEQFNLLI